MSRQIAQFTQATAERIADQTTDLVRGLGNAGRVFNALGADEAGVLWDALLDLLVVIALTVAVFLGLQRVFIPIYRRMGRLSEGAGLLRTFGLFSGSVAMDAFVVVAAWAIGYGLTLLFVGETGRIGIRQSLYLNAFLLIELTKVVVRAILSPNAPALRMLPLSDKAARAVNRQVTVIVSLIGYGQLLVVPIVNQSASLAAGRAVSAVIALMVLVYLTYLILAYRRPVAQWISDQIAPPDDDVSATDPETGHPLPDGTGHNPGVMVSLARNWYWFALAYLVFMFVTVLSRSSSAVAGTLVASGKIAAALIVASMLFGYLSKITTGGLTLPNEINQKLPLLERRLNRFVAPTLKAVRYLIVALVVLFALHTMGVIALGSWMRSQVGLNLSATLVTVSLILLAAFAVWLAITSWVDYRLNPDYGSTPTSRETTLLTLLRNAVTIAIVVLALMFSLSELGVNIGPLLASAGVFGLAIGFGAQKMVQDIITGVFIQFENAINVGDVITVGGTTGTVEKLSVRSVSLRDVNGTFHIIPFSSVDMVSNFTRDFSYFVCDMGVAYRENVEEVKQAMFDAFEELRADPEIAAFLLGDLEWLGLNAFGDSAVVLRAKIKTLPGKQWGIGRAYNAILKRVFDARDIEIPFPHQTLVFSQAKDGSTQPITIAGPEKAASS